MIRPFASPAVPHKLWLKNGEDTLRGRSPYLYGVVVCFCSQEGAICSRMAGPLSSFLGLCPGFFYENFKNEVLFDVPFAVDWGTCRRHWSISVGTNTPTVVNVHYLYCVGYLPPSSPPLSPDSSSFGKEGMIRSSQISGWSSLWWDEIDVPVVPVSKVRVPQE